MDSGTTRKRPRTRSMSTSSPRRLRRRTSTYSRASASPPSSSSRTNLNCFGMFRSFGLNLRLGFKLERSVSHDASRLASNDIDKDRSDDERETDRSDAPGSPATSRRLPRAVSESDLRPLPSRDISRDSAKHGSSRFCLLDMHRVIA